MIIRRDYKVSILILVFFLSVVLIGSNEFQSESFIKSKGFVPVDKSRFKNGKPSDELSLRWEKLLNNTCKEIMFNWWSKIQCDGKEDEYIDFGYLENNSKTGEFGKETLGGIRAPSEYAYVVAVSVLTKTYDSKYIGVQESVAVKRAVTIIKSLAKDHLINGGINHPWGNQWQSSQWASKCAIAGWLLWEYLEGKDKENVINMIEYEANRFLKVEPPAANENYLKNTRAEEDGWDADGIQAACGMLPGNVNNKRWFEKSIEYRATALASSNDVNSNKLLDGKPVSSLVTGYNIDTLGAVGNHQVYPHPDYMAASLRHTIEGVLYLSLGNQKIPEANKLNCDLIYQNFVNHKWNNESCIYRTDGTIYWPIDIESDRRFEFMTYALADAGGSILGYDDLANVKAPKWEDLHTEKALELHLTDFTAASAYLLHWLNYQGINFQ